MVSITESMDGYDIACEIRMERQALKDAAFLLLEGDTDIKRFNRYVDEGACSVVNCYGRHNAMKAIKLLYKNGFPGALAIIDADFDRLRGTLKLHEGIIYSEAHDLDLDWAQPDVVGRYLYEVGDQAKCDAHGSTDIIIDRILNALKPVSAARLLNAQGEIRCKLSNLDVRACFASFSVNVDSFLVLILKDKAVSDTERAALKTKIEAVASRQYDLRQLTNGHDFHCALGLSLRTDLGSRKEPQTWGKEVERHLRLAFDNADFVALTIVRSVNDWVRQNPPFRIFRADLTQPAY